MRKKGPNRAPQYGPVGGPICAHTTPPPPGDLPFAPRAPRPPSPLCAPCVFAAPSSTQHSPLSHQNVPQCSTPSLCAKRTHAPQPLAHTPNPAKAPQTTPHINRAKRTHVPFWHTRKRRRKTNSPHATGRTRRGPLVHGPTHFTALAQAVADASSAFLSLRSSRLGGRFVLSLKYKIASLLHLERRSPQCRGVPRQRAGSPSHVG
jgi:hypothetical protein